MKNILVIGEICEDIFIYGKVERLSPEAPIPVLIPTKKIVSSGMAGNVVRNIESLIKNGEFKVEGLHQNSKIMKTRYVEDKSNYPFIRVDESDDFVDKIYLSDNDLEKLKTYDCIIVSDYNKGFLSDEDLIKIGENSKFSVLDSKRKLKPEVMDNFDYIKLNENEFSNNFTTDEEKLKKIIITLGYRGALYNGKIFPSESPKETIDVSGAGDTFVSAFVLSYMKTLNVAISISYANKVCSIVVNKRGVAIP